MHTDVFLPKFNTDGFDIGQDTVVENNEWHFSINVTIAFCCGNSIKAVFWICKICVLKYLWFDT
jgi:hypothetical protein